MKDDKVVNGWWGFYTFNYYYRHPKNNITDYEVGQRKNVITINYPRKNKNINIIFINYLFQFKIYLNKFWVQIYSFLVATSFDILFDCCILEHIYGNVDNNIHYKLFLKKSWGISEQSKNNDIFKQLKLLSNVIH